jgi:hypothetical protein
MSDFLLFALFLGAWWAIQTWLLPRFGVPT